MNTEDSTEKQYPHCERWAAAGDKANTIREFLGWLEADSQPPLKVCKRWDSGDYLPELTCNRLDELLMQFFGVDAKEVEKERRAMLEACRKLNASATDNTSVTKTSQEVVVGVATSAA